MKGLLWPGKPKDKDQDLLDTLLPLAKTGDVDARNRLLEAYIPFVLRVASKVAHRYVNREMDDEYSVALMAMNEAIDGYDLARSSHFLSFAETIMRRRLVDYFRSQQNHMRSIPWTEFETSDEDDNGVVNYMEVRTSLAAHVQAEEVAARRQDIIEYSDLLTHYGLSLLELTESSPKHADARRNAIEVARLVASDEVLLKYVLEKKALPLKELEKRVSVSRKTLERQRKYILAVVLLFSGDFEHLKSYVSEV